MKGEITKDERERLMAEANDRAERDRGHRWWVEQTAPQRKKMLTGMIKRGLNGTEDFLNDPFGVQQ